MVAAGVAEEVEAASSPFGVDVALLLLRQLAVLVLFLGSVAVRLRYAAAAAVEGYRPLRQLESAKLFTSTTPSLRRYAQSEQLFVP